LSALANRTAVVTCRWAWTHRQGMRAAAQGSMSVPGHCDRARLGRLGRLGRL